MTFTALFQMTAAYSRIASNFELLACIIWGSSLELLKDFCKCATSGIAVFILLMLIIMLLACKKPQLQVMI